MGIPTLIGSAHTASNSANVQITSGIDSTYDEYMFVFTDINPATDAQAFEFQVNVDGQSGFNEIVTNTMFRALHTEDDSTASLAYTTGEDQAQGTADIIIAREFGNGSDESMSGILHLFSPSNTTYVKHYYARTIMYSGDNGAHENFGAGYINVTGAIDEIQFKMSSGNFDGVIQMYGIS